MCEIEEEAGEEAQKEQGEITQLTVIEYIFRELKHDDLELFNPTYREMLVEAKNNLESSKLTAERFFVYHSNPKFSKIASDLLTEPYQESKIHSKYRKIETEEERLIELVPHVMHDFKFKLITSKIEELNVKLKTEKEEQKIILLMREINRLQIVNRALAQQLGERIILKI
jgi:DNA primase